MKLEVITVTEEFIRDGIKQSCQRCPVALALSHYFDTPNVHVASQIWINGVGTFHTPHSVINFINHFDQRYFGPCRPKPFTFHLFRI